MNEIPNRASWFASQQLQPWSFTCGINLYINRLMFHIMHHSFTSQQLKSRSCACIHLYINTTIGPHHASGFTTDSAAASSKLRLHTYVHKNNDFLKTFSFKLHPNRPRSAMISSDPGQRPGKLEHNVSQPSHR